MKNKLSTSITRNKYFFIYAISWFSGFFEIALYSTCSANLLQKWQKVLGNSGFIWAISIDLSNAYNHQSGGYKILVLMKEVQKYD